MTLTAGELRDIDEGTYLVVELHDDEYWEYGGFGEVQYVHEYDSGSVEIGLHGAALTVPADARKGLRSSGRARGANALRVDRVYER